MGGYGQAAGSGGVSGGFNTNNPSGGTDQVSADVTGNGSAGNTAAACGRETQPDNSKAEATSAQYIPAAVGSGSLTSAGVSSSQVDGKDTAN
jgi:hypothetical protein